MEQGKRWATVVKRGMEKIGGQRLLIVVGLLGMGLILLSQCMGSPKRGDEGTSAREIDQYARGLETQLTDMISAIDGVGSCRVMVTLENGMEYLYTDSSDLITEVLPTVKGVVVVCDGADNTAVSGHITEAVTTALHITQKRVCVTKSSEKGRG